jgi:hypothetical protein
VIKHQDEFGLRIKIEPKDDLYSIAKWLDQPVFIGRAEQEGTIGDRQGDRFSAPIDNQASLIDCSAERRLQTSV